MYLDEAAVCQILTDLMRHIESCSAAFDYFAEDVIKYATGDPEITSVVERFAAMGAPWTYGIEILRRKPRGAARTCSIVARSPTFIGPTGRISRWRRRSMAIIRFARSKMR